MDSTIHYSYCPACGSSLINPVLRAKDYTVSGQHFTIWQCDNCSLRFTQDAPDVDQIGDYYKSENYISHSNISRGIINRLYQVIRKKTIRQKRKLISELTGKKHGELLDVGSGTGAFVSEMKENGWQVVGLEPDPGAREIAQEVFDIELKNVHELFNLPVNSFDAITLWHVLEHVHDLQNYLQQLKNLLRQDGRLIIAVPNYTSYEASVYKEYWAAYDVPRHLYHFSPVSMELLTEKNGMKIVGYKPMWFDSFYVSLLSSKYKNVHPDDRAGGGKTNWLAAVWNGFRSNFKAMSDARKCSSVIYILSK